MTTDQSPIPPEPPTDTGYSDLISSIVARGYGTIAAGSGMMVVYGPPVGHFTGKRVIFVPNDMHDEEAECLLREAVLLPRTIVRNPSSKRVIDDISPTEE